MNMNMNKAKEMFLRAAKFVWRKSAQGISTGWLVALVFFIALQFEPEKFMRFVSFLEQPGTMWKIYWALIDDVVFFVPIFVICGALAGFLRPGKKEKTEV